MKLSRTIPRSITQHSRGHREPKNRRCSGGEKLERAAVSLDERSCDDEAEAAPAALARGREKRREQLGGVRLRDPRSIVADVEGRGAQHDPGLVRAVEPRVVEKARQD